MVKITATLLKFDEQGEKTGWTYFVIPPDVAGQIKPGCRKIYRVKGKLDNFKISGVAIMPMGDGSFIMPVNAAMRKGTGKRKGATITAMLEADEAPLKFNEDFMACLSDEPAALEHFNSLSGSHRNYFNKWIDSAKTEPARTKRIAMAVSALSGKMGYPEMMREQKAKKGLL
ncbi:YdeI/OmpD-associated family protein [Parafilimonas sp.]|uniref:YdeI/OmpD-associated family protein n=1 Tax=Parafilimonas sp. TaxID=1969739 RepID=UPI0039E28878